MSRELAVSRLPMGGTVLAAILALLTGSAALWLLTVLLGLLTATVKLWGRFALTRVSYRRSFTASRCEVGETIGLDVELVNRKVLPVSHLMVDDTVPDQLQLSAKTLTSIGVGKETLRFLFTMGWYEKVIRHYTVTPTRRGYYQLGPALLRAGDPFGFVEREAENEERVTLVVYPRVLPLAQLGLPTRRPFGDISSRDRLFEDPMRFGGVRDYQQGDPLSRIHWKATAVAQRLQVKVLDPSAHAGMALFLNTWSYDYYWQGTDREAFETACSVAASVAAWAAEEGLPFGLFANGLVHEWGFSLRQRVGRGSQVLPLALEGLARLEPYSRDGIWQLMAEEQSQLSYGTSVVIITRSMTDELLAAVDAARRSGRPVTVLRVGNTDGVFRQLPGVTYHHITGEESIAGAKLA